MFYPNFIKEGDVIGVCAPSAGVGGKLDSFDTSLDTLYDSGYEIYETESVRNEGCPSAPAEVRGDEFNCLFADSDISMVISASGGDYTVEMLPYIDQELVKNNPKWFAGYSDPTAIEMLLTTKLDIATIYGVNAGAWDWRPLHDYQYNSLSLLKGDLPVQYSYEAWASHGFDEETGQYEMDAPVEWILLVPSDIEEPDDEDEEAEYNEFEYNSGRQLAEASELEVSGRLIGGCIDVLTWIIGTPYEDLTGFAERYKEDGLIWFFDNFELNPMDLMYALIKMKLMGLFDNARAVVFGRTCFTGDAEDIDYLEQIERVFAETEVPVIWNADIGHTKPSFTLINGALAHLTYEDGNARLEMSLQ